MKILVLLLISFSAMASNWVPVEKIQSQSVEAYQLESSCPGKCLDVGDDPEVVSKGFASVSEEETEDENGNPVTIYSLVIDQAGFDAYKAANLSAQNLAAAKASAKRLRECGEGVIDLILVRNQAKNLSTAQVKSMVAMYAPIQGLLTSGSLNSAKEEILAVNADGTLVTEADKTALAAEVDKCLSP